MSALSLRLPNSIHRHIKEIASQEGVSINQFISSAVSEKISAISTENFLLKRAKQANRKFRFTRGDTSKILELFKWFRLARPSWTCAFEFSF